MVDEGYIKFRCEQTGAGVVPAGRLMEMNKWRTRLHDLGLIGMYHENHPDVSMKNVGFGNISVRSGKGFIISGSATGDKRVLAPEDYAEVLEVDIERNFLRYIGRIRPSSESMTHAAIYGSNLAANAVIHVHNMEFWKKMLGKIPTTSRSVPYGTPEMARELERILTRPDTKQTGIVCMGGHTEGLISFGSSLDEAGNTLLTRFSGQ